MAPIAGNHSGKSSCRCCRRRRSSSWSCRCSACVRSAARWRTSDGGTRAVASLRSLGPAKEDRIQVRGRERMNAVTISRQRQPAAPVRLGGVVSHLILIVGAALMLTPFVWMISTSLKPPYELFTVPPTWIPSQPQWETYVKAMSAGNFGRYAFNSLLLGVTNMVSNVILSALAGYAFARLRFPGRSLLFVLVLATLMVPYQVTIIPLFVIIRHIPLFGGNDFLGQGGIGWINSYWGLIVPGAVGAF